MRSFDNPIKICHLTSVHPQNDVRILVKECASLAAAGAQVTLLVLGGTSTVQYGVQIIGSGEKPANRLRRGYSGTKVLLEKAIELKADVYHLHDPELLSIAVKLKRETGAKIIFDSHEYVPDQIKDKVWIPKAIRGTISAAYRSWQNRILRKIDGLIIVTPDHIPFFSHLNIPVEVIANYPIIHGSEFQSRRVKEVVKFVYIGGLTPTRGIRELVQAIGSVEGELHLAGIFSPADFGEQLEALPGWKKVHYHGMLEKDEVRKLLSECHVGLVTLHPTPSYLKSIPVKMLEYMETGLPFIASDFPAFRKLVKDRKPCLFTDPENPAAIAAAMNEFIKDPHLSNTMGEIGYKLVRDSYSWKAEAEKLIDFYKKMCVCRSSGTNHYFTDVNS